MKILLVSHLWALALIACVCIACANTSAQADPPAKPAPSFADVSYGPSPHQLLDIYLPPGGAGPFPAMIMYGTIWVPGKHADGTSALFPAQCAVIAVETRTMADGQADKDPAPVSYVELDACRAVQFIRLHARDYNIDPDHLATAGSSQAGIPALYVALADDKANPNSADPVERMSTKVDGVMCLRCQPSIDPKRMQEWVPGVKWGAPSFNCSFEESLAKRDELLPLINKWSPDALLHPGAPPIYFYNNWPLTKPDDVKEMDYLVHSPAWGLGFKQVADAHGVTVYNDYPGHPADKYKNPWDFMIHILKPSTP